MTFQNSLHGGREVMYQRSILVMGVRNCGFRSIQILQGSDDCSPKERQFAHLPGARITYGFKLLAMCSAFLTRKFVRNKSRREGLVSRKYREQRTEGLKMRRDVDTKGLAVETGER